jgi:hypothetical protein
VECAGATHRQIDGLTAVFSAEFIHSTSGIHHLLLTGIEGMTRRTDLDVQLFLTQCGSGDNFVAATANNFDFLVPRMNVRFHD